MDAQDAFDILDALTKEPVSELAPLQEEALRCAEESPDLAREYRLRTPFERQISGRMAEVEIPAGLKDRLLENARRESDRSAAVVPASKPDSLPQRGVSRRMVLLSVLAGGIASVFALIYYFQPPQLEPKEIDRFLTDLWRADAPSFDGNFQTELPPGGWRSTGIRFEPDWHGAAFDERTAHDLAFKRFEFVSSRRTSHEGLLAAVPASSLAARPGNHDPFTGEIRYLTTSDGSQYAVVSWSEPEFDLVYFLVVPAEDQTLKALQDILSIPPA